MKQLYAILIGCIGFYACENKAYRFLHSNSFPDLAPLLAGSPPNFSKIAKAEESSRFVSVGCPTGEFV